MIPTSTIKRSLSLGILIVISLSLVYVSPGYALTPTTTPKVEPSTKEKEAPTPTTSDTLSEKLKQIKILKDKIATKVAEIREKEKGGMASVVKSVDTDSITVAGIDGNRTISFSDDTTFYTIASGSKTESTIKKVKEGDIITALGYYGDSKNTLTAKYIYIPLTVRRIAGKIADIDKDNFAITVKEKQGNQIVDIENTTRMFAYDEKQTRSKLGFSKLKIGDVVHILGTANAKDSSRVTASKLFVLSLAANTEEPTTVPSPTPKVTITAKTTSIPSSSAKKTTPTPTKKP